MCYYINLDDISNIFLLHNLKSELPGGSSSKEFAYHAGDPGSISGWGRSPGGGNGNPLQYSCLGNPVDRGAWWATDYGVAKNWTQPSNQHFDFTFFHNINLRDMQF